MVVLLNRVGVGGGNPFGYSDAGLQITLDGARPPETCITTVLRRLRRRRMATGRARPQSLVGPSDFDGAPRLGFYLAGPERLIVTPFVADVLGGGGVTVVESWGLDITTGAVPEPAAVRMAVVNTLAAAVAGLIRRQRRQRGGRGAGGA